MPLDMPATLDWDSHSSAKIRTLYKPPHLTIMNKPVASFYPFAPEALSVLPFNAFKAGCHHFANFSIGTHILLRYYAGDAFLMEPQYTVVIQMTKLYPLYAIPT